MSAGCGGSDKGQVHGKVTFEGQPVTGGSVTFAPLAGSGHPATGRITPDGSFVLSTDANEDGAMIGRHQVVYSAPSALSETPDPSVPASPYAGLVPRTPEVEVQAGKNQVTIELVRP